MNQVVSFGLWGNEKDYTIGAIKNARLLKSIYPGWEGWFYCSEDVAPPIRREISQYARVIDMPLNQGIEGMFWRMMPIFEAGVDITLVRDADSRINSREKAAVDYWLSTRKSLHIMRDHPAHVWPIMGGMWGYRSDRINFKEKYDRAAKLQYGDDQRFLASEVYPAIGFDYVAHDSNVNSPYPLCLPMPDVKPEYGTFIGQRINWEDGIGRP